MTDVELARTIASWAHRNQTYNGGRYADTHLSAVATMVRDKGPEYEMAALLHDIVEDTDTTFDDLINFGIVDIVVDAVKLLTRNPVAQSHSQYIDTIATSGNRIAVRVKIADLTTNIAFSEREPFNGMATERWAPALIRLLRVEAANGWR